MSQDPKIGGKLREETFRSRQVTGWMNLVARGPRKGDWSDLWIERHREAPRTYGENESA
jgi:hypothetical protein